MRTPSPTAVNRGDGFDSSSAAPSLVSTTQAVNEAPELPDPFPNIGSGSRRASRASSTESHSSTLRRGPAPVVATEEVAPEVATSTVGAVRLVASSSEQTRVTVDDGGSIALGLATIRAPHQAAGMERIREPEPTSDATVRAGVQAMLAKLNVAIDQARAHPQRGPVRQFLVDLLSNVDVVRAVAPGADRAIVQDERIREGLRGAQELLEHMRSVVASCASHLTASQVRKLEMHFSRAERGLKEFSTESPAGSRAGILALGRAISTFILLGVPMVEDQKLTVAFNLAIASKSALRGVGLGLRSNTHISQIKEHFIERDFVPLQQSLLFAVGLIPRLMGNGPAKEGLHEITHSEAYLASVGVASVAAGAVVFYPKEITAAVNKLFHGHPHPHLNGEETFGDLAVRRLKDLGRSLCAIGRPVSGERTDAMAPASRRRRQRDADPVPPEIRRALEEVFDVSRQASSGVANLRGEMKKIGRLSDSGNRTIEGVEGAFDGLHKAMAVVLGEPEPSTGPNVDFIGKAFLAGLALAVCATNVPFMTTNNTYGLIDLVADTAFVFLIMAMDATNRSISLQTSVDNFAQFCGFSLAMVPVLALNSSQGDPMDKDWASTMWGAAALATLGNVAAAPFGQAAGVVAGKIASRFGSASPISADLESARSVTVRSREPSLETVSASGCTSERGAAADDASRPSLEETRQVVSTPSPSPAVGGAEANPSRSTTPSRSA